MVGMETTSGDTKPVTFDTVSWTDPEAASPAADTPQDASASAPSPAPATEAPATETPTGEGSSTDGPIPLDRHKAILEAERKRTAEAEAKWQRVQWAETLAESGRTPDQIRDALSLWDGIDAQPAEFLEQFYNRLQSSPEFAPQLRSFAGRILAGGRKSVEPIDPTGDPEPGPDLQDQSGNTLFSSKQMQKWQQWRERQLEARFNERLSPLLTAHQQAQERATIEHAYQAEYARQAKVLEAMREKPHFKEHEAEIKAYLAAKNYEGTLDEAYVHVLTTKVLPSLQSQERAATLAELKTQAAASSAQPSAAADKAPLNPQSFRDPRLKWT